jgi:hypothetical protein
LLQAAGIYTAEPLWLGFDTGTFRWRVTAHHLGQDCQMQHILEEAISDPIPMVTMAHHLEIVHSLENTVVDLKEIIAELTIERCLNRGRSH